ncbi:hypothetical protein [Nonomuraea rhizosphaerae]|nr:hypothetical protein [Nonomuraea rhizosphaerae]
MTTITDEFARIDAITTDLLALDATVEGHEALVATQAGWTV